MQNMIARMAGTLAVIALAWQSVACKGAESSLVAPSVVSSSGVVAMVDVAVMSGREQPPPKESKIARGTPMTVRLVGLGPPKGTIEGPHGTPVSLDPMPAQPNGSSTALHFTPASVGTYVVKGEAGAVLAKLIAE